MTSVYEHFQVETNSHYKTKAFVANAHIGADKTLWLAPVESPVIAGLRHPSSAARFLSRARCRQEHCGARPVFRVADQRPALAAGAFAEEIVLRLPGETVQPWRRRCPARCNTGVCHDTSTPMKITVEIPESFLKDVRSLAAREHTTVRALIEEGLRRVTAERKNRQAVQASQGFFRRQRFATGDGRRFLAADSRRGV
jgi:hypothetical protein